MPKASTAVQSRKKPLLELRNLNKTFYGTGNNELKAINNLSLKVTAGQVFGFLGLNGAGKTTTVKMIVDLLRSDSGTITIAGKPQHDPTSRAVIGFMPEQPQFYRHLKAREVLEFTGELFEMERAETTKRAKFLLEKVGLTDAAERPVRSFSKGMHQRLAFAVALMNNPDLLILDEPLDGLDPLGRLDFKRLILEQKRLGKTVFFSSHILSDVEELCDEIAIIERGQLIAQGTPKSMTTGTKKSLETVFVDKVTSHQLATKKKNK